MPVYEYKCEKCNVEFTENRSIFDERTLISCVHCDTPLMRVYNVPVVTFNGSGFHINDKKGGN